MSQTPIAEETLRQYQALTEGTGVVDVSDRTQVRITGADRAKFLHGFCTNDILRLQIGGGCEAFLPNARGRLLGHVLVFCGPAGMTLETSPGQAESIIRHLERYVIREDVQFEDLKGRVAELFIAGKRSPVTLEGLVGSPAPAELLTRSACDWGGIPISLRRVPLAVGPAFLLSFPLDRLAEARQRLVDAGAMPSGAEAFEMIRVEAGFPLYGRDINDDHLPQEVNRDAQAISFTKGCYLGQETVARIDALGHVNRRLVRLRLSGPEMPKPGQELMADGQAIGRVTSAVWSPRCGSPLALAYVRHGLERPGTRIETSSGLAETVDWVN